MSLFEYSHPPPSEASVTDLSLSSQFIANVGRSWSVAQVNFSRAEKIIRHPGIHLIYGTTASSTRPGMIRNISGLFAWLFCLQNWLCAYLPNILCLFYFIVYLFVFSFNPTSLPVEAGGFIFMSITADFSLTSELTLISPDLQRKIHVNF